MIRFHFASIRTAVTLAICVTAHSAVVHGQFVASRLASPRLASPRLASPRLASPRLASPRLGSQRLVSPRLGNTSDEEKPALSQAMRQRQMPREAPQADTANPPHRRHHAVAYDPATKQVLVYGGQHLVSNSDAPMLDDLWGWNGQRWTQIAAHTGIAMIAHQLFADGQGGVFARGSPRGLTTRLNGQQWSVVVEDNATPREMSAGAYDAARNRYVLFGGHIGGRSFPRDTWEFDGQRWSQVATSGPPPMLGGDMAYDAARRVIVLFGGLDSTGKKLGDTWEWDATRWTRVTSVGPSARFGSGIAYDARRRETVLFGGMDSTNTKLNDTWAWNGKTWRQLQTDAAPPARTEGHMAYDASREVIVMFGGEGEAVIPTLGDTWEWNGTRWTKVR